MKLLLAFAALAGVCDAGRSVIHLGPCTIEHDDISPNVINSTCPVRSPETAALHAEVQELREQLQSVMQIIAPITPLPPSPPPPAPPPIQVLGSLPVVGNSHEGHSAGSLTGCYFRFNQADLTALGVSCCSSDIYFVRHLRSSGQPVHTGAAIFFGGNSYNADGKGDDHGSWSSVCPNHPVPGWLQANDCDSASKFQEGDTLEILLPRVGTESGSHDCWLQA